MSVNILTIKDALVNLIHKNNTTTSSLDVSAGLVTRVYDIIGANSEKMPIMNILYPVVFVEVKREAEEFAQLGNSARRNVEIGIDVVPVIEYGLGITTAEINPKEENDDEIIKLTQNIQELIRNKITLSNTVDSVRISETAYDAKYSDNVYNVQSRISLIIKRRG